jgi:hypothetical protein
LQKTRKQSVAKKHGMELSINQKQEDSPKEPNTNSSDSEFGDNVDLF